MTEESKSQDKTSLRIDKLIEILNDLYRKISIDRLKEMLEIGTTDVSRSEGIIKELADNQNKYKNNNVNQLPFDEAFKQAKSEKKGKLKVNGLTKVPELKAESEIVIFNGIDLDKGSNILEYKSGALVSKYITYNGLDIYFCPDARPKIVIECIGRLGDETYSNYNVHYSAFDDKKHGEISILNYSTASILDLFVLLGAMVYKLKEVYNSPSKGESIKVMICNYDIDSDEYIWSTVEINLPKIEAYLFELESFYDYIEEYGDDTNCEDYDFYGQLVNGVNFLPAIYEDIIEQRKEHGMTPKPEIDFYRNVPKILRDKGKK